MERFVNFDGDRALIRIFADPFEASYEDTKTTLWLELIDLHCSDDLKSKFKEGDLLNFYKCLPKDISESVAEGSCWCKFVWKHLHLRTSFLIDETK